MPPSVHLSSSPKRAALVLLAMSASAAAALDIGRHPFSLAIATGLCLITAASAFAACEFKPIFGDRALTTATAALSAGAVFNQRSCGRAETRALPAAERI